MTSSSGGGRGTRERVTVSLSAEVVRGLRTAAEQSDAGSVSAYVEHVLRKEEWLRRWTAAVGEPDPHALDQARRALAEEQTQRRQAS
jgi:hypothetical protein